MVLFGLFLKQGKCRLEHYLLDNPEEKRIFFAYQHRIVMNLTQYLGDTTKIFPMFEFELKGDMNELRQVGN